MYNVGFASVDETGVYKMENNDTSRIQNTKTQIEVEYYPFYILCLQHGVTSLHDHFDK